MYKKYIKSLFVPFIFLILSCWMSSSNKVIWIFVSFVGLIAIVSGNRLNFFNGFMFSHLEIFVSKLITTTSRQSFLCSLNRSESESLKVLFKKL